MTSNYLHIAYLSQLYYKVKSTQSSSYHTLQPRNQTHQNQQQKSKTIGVYHICSEIYEDATNTSGNWKLKFNFDELKNELNSNQLRLEKLATRSSVEDGKLR